MRGIQFVDMLDLLVYENHYSPRGNLDEDIAPPRGKFVAWHRLAHAISGRRSVLIIPISKLGPRLVTYVKELQKGKTGRKYETLFALLFAEAYATEGAYAIYYWENLPWWDRTFNMAGFIQEHKDLYEGDQKTNIALCFLYNDKMRSIPGVYPSYLGWAQAMSELHIPFNVVFGGDGHYVQDRLTIDDLKPYSLVIVCSPINPTDNQKNVIREYVEQGGTCMAFEPEQLAISTSGLTKDVKMGKGRFLIRTANVTRKSIDDLGTRFFLQLQGPAS